MDLLNQCYIITDSGSTKTDWRIISRTGQIQQVLTSGLNPYYVSAKEIKNIIKEKISPLIKFRVKKIFFYGSGMESIEKVSGLRKVFLSLFKDAEIAINGDLLAAAKATSGYEDGICCISGTGSGACLYKDGEIVEKRLGHGIWLGDEGSAGHIGKSLIIDYLNEKLPPLLNSKFEKKYKDRRKEILQKVYHEGFPNRYLAGFSRFVYHHRKEAYCYQLIYNSFSSFFETFVLPISDFNNYGVHFVGSTAYYYSDILLRAAKDKNISIGKIIEKPIAGLSLYHIKELGIK